MRKIDIANTYDVTPIFVTWLIRGERYTTMIPLAQAVAKFTGKAPIDFLSKRRGFRELALKIHPELSKKCAVHGKRVSDLKA